MTRHHRHHPKTHGPSLLARKGLLAIVKVDKTEIGRHHFVAAESVSEIYEDGGGMVHMTVAVDEPLVYTVPEGVTGKSWAIEMWSGDEWAVMDTISYDTDVRSGYTVEVRGPIKLAIDPLKAKVLLRTYRDTDGQFVPSDFYDDDDDD